MRYNKNGEALLHRLGTNANFGEVVLTARYLGYELQCEGRVDFVKLNTSGEDQYGHPKFDSRTIRLEELIEWLNQEMVSRDIIKLEVEP